MTKRAMLFASLVAGVLVAAPTSAAAGPATKPAEKIVCKRFVPVGSLARTKRVCNVAAEWQRERDAARDEGQRLTTNMSGEREVAVIRPAGSPHS